MAAPHRCILTDNKKNRVPSNYNFPQSALLVLGIKEKTSPPPPLFKSVSHPVHPNVIAAEFRNTVKMVHHSKSLSF